MRTDEGRAIRSGAGTVVSEARESVAVDHPEAVFDSAPANSAVGAEPGPVPARVARHTLNLRVGFAGVGLGTINGVFKEHLFEPSAVHEGHIPFVMDAGDSEVARELNPCNILNSGAEVLWGAASIDVSEQVRWLDGVVSSAGSGEVVRSRD